jgi:predicted transcriptional regulator YdeE
MVRMRLIFLVACCSLLLLKADQSALHQTHVRDFYVAGVEVRTSNELEMRSKGKIAELVARVRKERVLKKLSNRVGIDTYALYTNYKSDHNGPYTYFLGAKVSSAGSVPASMVLRKVPAGRYAMFSGAGVPAVNVVLKLWQHVWDLEAAHQVDRAYKTDFEVHHGVDENRDPGGRIDLYVGLK